MKKVKPNYKQKTKDEARASKQFEYFETGALRHAVYYVSGKASYYPLVKPESSFSRER
jgi:hypothetical protein